MHAHTGVMSHLLAPRDSRMVARSDRWSPFPCQRQRASVGHGSDGRVERRAWRVEGREAPSLVGKDVARTVPIPQPGIGLDL